jgi:hypothetical protein
MANDWYSIEIDHFPDGSGSLSVVEFGKHFDFAIRRVFWVSQVVDDIAVRGGHAHEALSQVLFCAKGHCKITLEGRTGSTAVFELSERGPALYVNGPVWRTMSHFSNDCCLMVLCDREYALDTVIRSYPEFLSL